ncbi:hypothetical protein S7711_11341 [Stachybotrys chartarum IBT 7711]|uniref:Uncharacterized protein n=1 Tax=Stachybotrys chartarum (strain CBS 109288 / IBT 7711) TaxID=1280523 RepID=A0A084AQJ9_STACB|nr:hypothetical protein S7711_11341 [Stachybotrys chartarum IBT 7711]
MQEKGFEPGLIQDAESTMAVSPARQDTIHSGTIHVRVLYGIGVIEVQGNGWLRRPVSVFACGLLMLPYVSHLAKTTAARVTPQERHGFDWTVIRSHTFPMFAASTGAVHAAFSLLATTNHSGLGAAQHQAANGRPIDTARWASPWPNRKKEDKGKHAGPTGRQRTLWRPVAWCTHPGRSVLYMTLKKRPAQARQLWLLWKRESCRQPLQNPMCPPRRSLHSFRVVQEEALMIQTQNWYDGMTMQAKLKGLALSRNHEPPELTISFSTIPGSFLTEAFHKAQSAALQDVQNATCISAQLQGSHGQPMRLPRCNETVSASTSCLPVEGRPAQPTFPSGIAELAEWLELPSTALPPLPSPGQRHRAWEGVLRQRTALPSRRRVAKHGRCGRRPGGATQGHATARPRPVVSSGLRRTRRVMGGAAPKTEPSSAPYS